MMFLMYSSCFTHLSVAYISASVELLVAMVCLLDWSWGAQFASVSVPTAGVLTGKFRKLCISWLVGYDSLLKLIPSAFVPFKYLMAYFAAAICFFDEWF